MSSFKGGVMIMNQAVRVSFIGAIAAMLIGVVALAQQNKALEKTISSAPQSQEVAQ